MTDREYFARHGHSPEAANTVAIDFDGTLYPRVGLYEYPYPIPGAAEAVRRLKAAGFRIVIFTSRLAPEFLQLRGYQASDQIDYIEALLRRDDIPFDALTGEKVPARAYVDDLAIRFDGAWQPIADWLLWSRGEPE